jgi:hypothetical protein
LIEQILPETENKNKKPIIRFLNDNGKFEELSEMTKRKADGLEKI